jgi:hypothetical protein
MPEASLNQYVGASVVISTCTVKYQASNFYSHNHALSAHNDPSCMHCQFIHSIALWVLLLYKHWPSCLWQPSDSSFYSCLFQCLIPSPEPDCHLVFWSYSSSRGLLVVLDSSYLQQQAALESWCSSTSNHANIVLSTTVLSVSTLRYNQVVTGLQHSDVPSVLKSIYCHPQEPKSTWKLVSCLHQWIETHLTQMYLFPSTIPWNMLLYQKIIIWVTMYSIPFHCSSQMLKDQMSSIIGPICLHLNIFFNHTDMFSHSNPLQGYLYYLHHWPCSVE